MFGWLEFFFCYDNVVRLTDTQIERGHGETNSARGNFSNLKKKRITCYQQGRERNCCVDTSLAVQRENFGYFPRECRACNKQKKTCHLDMLFGKQRTYNYYKLCVS